MRALLMCAVLASASPVLADPGPMFIRAPRAPALEVALPAAVPAPKRISLVLAHDPAEQRVADPAKLPVLPTLMEQLRDLIYEELPVVSTAVVAPLPISTANGTLAGVGVLGKF